MEQNAHGHRHDRHVDRQSRGRIAHGYFPRFFSSFPGTRFVRRKEQLLPSSLLLLLLLLSLVVVRCYVGVTSLFLSVYISRLPLSALSCSFVPACRASLCTVPCSALTCLSASCNDNHSYGEWDVTTPCIMRTVQQAKVKNRQMRLRLPLPTKRTV